MAGIATFYRATEDLINLPKKQYIAYLVDLPLQPVWKCYNFPHDSLPFS
jgi:hypothetical protein